jgi:hypothetical protein
MESLLRSYSRPEKLPLKIHTGSSGTFYSYLVENARPFLQTTKTWQSEKNPGIFLKCPAFSTKTAYPGLLTQRLKKSLHDSLCSALWSQITTRIKDAAESVKHCLVKCLLIRMQKPMPSNILCESAKIGITLDWLGKPNSLSPPINRNYTTLKGEQIIEDYYQKSLVPFDRQENFLWFILPLGCNLFLNL